MRVEIDTPGGQVDHMLAIGEEIQKLEPIPTAAYVCHAEGGMKWGAVSAGVYLAVSCKKMYLQPGAVIGGAAPVMVGPQGMVPVGEKGLSVAREKFRARAEQNGYPGNLIVAMVDQDHTIYEINLDGKKRFLTLSDIDRLRAEGRSFDIPPTPYYPAGKLVTLTYQQAEAAGLGRVAESRGQIYEDMGLTSVTEETVTPSWSENMVGFLAQPIVSFVLLAVGILGIWVEFKTPGFGAAGAIGIAALGLLFFGNYLAGLAEVPEILLFFAGVALVAVELLVMPGTGIFAVLGALCIFAGLVLSFQDFALPDPKAAPWQVSIFTHSIGRVAGSFVAAALGVMALLRFLPKVPILGRIVLKDDVAAWRPPQRARPTWWAAWRAR